MHKTEQEMLDAIVSFFPGHTQEARELLEINLFRSPDELKVASVSGKYISLTTFYQEQERAYERRQQTGLHPITALHQSLTRRPYRSIFRNPDILGYAKISLESDHPPGDGIRHTHYMTLDSYDRTFY